MKLVLDEPEEPELVRPEEVRLVRTAETGAPAGAPGAGVGNRHSADDSAWFRLVDLAESFDSSMDTMDGDGGGTWGDPTGSPLGGHWTSYIWWL